MNFELSEDELAIRDLARSFARDICGPGAAERDRNEEFPTEQIKRAAEFGLMGLLVPEEYGGAELSNLALSLALIEINKVDASVGVTLSVHNSLASSCVDRWGTQEAKAEYLPKLASGQWLGAYALSEVSEDYIFLQANQGIHLSSQRGFGKHFGGLLETGSRDKA